MGIFTGREPKGYLSAACPGVTAPLVGTLQEPGKNYKMKRDWENFVGKKDCIFSPNFGFFIKMETVNALIREALKKEEKVYRNDDCPHDGDKLLWYNWPEDATEVATIIDKRALEKEKK